MTGFIDSHCHLTYEGLGDRIAEVVNNAASVGVREFVSIATDLADAQRTFALARQYTSIHVVCGIHPHNAAKVSPGWDEELTQLASRQDVRGIGEMGLDYHYNFADRGVQSQIFEKQLEIASHAEKPVVIHCREAHGDTLSTLQKGPKLSRVVFHCFTGTIAEARDILDHGHWISLTGVVTFKKSDELREVARMIPDDRIMIETDSPYLSPEPIRSKRPNEPAHMIHTAECIARVRGLSIDEFAALTVANTRRFFNLPSGEL
jgi:TatD DNase family protein